VPKLTDYQLVHNEQVGTWEIYPSTVDTWERGKGISIEPDSQAWFEWLASVPSSFSFQYFSPHFYNFTARKEKRGQRAYWYAYVKVGGKVRKAYLGKTDHLTGELLAEKAMLLTQRKNKRE
jgi:hypothetical protein